MIVTGSAVGVRVGKNNAAVFVNENPKLFAPAILALGPAEILFTNTADPRVQFGFIPLAVFIPVVPVDSKE